MFNEFAVIMQDIRPEEMVAFSQSVLDRGNNTDTTHSLFLYISRLYKYEDCLYTDDICEFCKGLYAAEGFRQYLMSGEKDYCNIADIHTLPLRLRNDCFDVYIRLCTDRITKDLELDNARLYPPTELEGMQSLLEQCTYSVNRMEGFKQFKNSYAYARLWYLGADDVLAMATLFLRYLQDKIQLKTKSPDSSVVAHYYVNGDYVAGSKQVGTHIDNVATGGIGVQNNTTTQPE